MSNPLPAIWPNTETTLHDFFRRLHGPYEDKPIVPMDENNARNMDVIWASLEDLSKRWRGHYPMMQPDLPTDRRVFWARFAKNRQTSLLPVVTEFVAGQDGKGKLAIDLGCGNSPAVKSLLNRGWRVLAVDNSPGCLDILAKANTEAVASGQLKIREADMVDFKSTEPADLVLAEDSFPYLDPAKFRQTWEKIHRTCLKDGGFLVGSFFRAPVHEADIGVANMFKEMGAWLFPDRRMVRALLSQTGYDVKTCRFHNEGTQEPLCIQFIAQKKKPNESADEKGS